jgi:hypothetical protein
MGVRKEFGGGGAPHLRATQQINKPTEALAKPSA